MRTLLVKPYFFIFSIIILLVAGFVAWQVSESPSLPQSSSTLSAYQLFVIERNAEDQHTIHQLDLAEDGQLLNSTIILSPRTGYQLTQNNANQIVFTHDDGSQRQFVKTQNMPDEVQIETWTADILAQVQPLSGPREFAYIPNSREGTIFVMTGEGDTYLNLHLLTEDKEIQQLTQLESLLGEDAILLSTSVEFIAWRPQHPNQFLYRVRLQDIEGAEFNQLNLYDLVSNTSSLMPYFGKSPVWSPDGQILVGARFNSDTQLYELISKNLVTGETTYVDNGCNPQFSLDGLWLAYDTHISSQHQNYTDCFASGEIKLIQIVTQEIKEITQALTGYAQVVVWQE